MLFSWWACVYVCVCVCDTLFMSMAAGVISMMLWNCFPPIMYMYISGVGLCVHVFMNPMPSWFVCVFLKCFNILCYASGFYMLLFLCQMFMMHVCMCVCVVVVVRWHCSAQLSMFNMEKRYRNEIIITSHLSSPRVVTEGHLWCIVQWLSNLIAHVGLCHSIQKWIWGQQNMACSYAGAVHLALLLVLQRNAATVGLLKGDWNSLDPGFVVTEMVAELWVLSLAAVYCHWCFQCQCEGRGSGFLGHMGL